MCRTYPLACGINGKAQYLQVGFPQALLRSIASFRANSLCAALNLSTTTSHRSIKSSRPFIRASYAVVPSLSQLVSAHGPPLRADSPYVCIRIFIFASDGCGIEYPQNSTKGLD